ncbi:MAG: hypothetical protein GY834_11965 [Bacteroidetes bacterium]|nr:hypothetical protein [Bacteroidota bacterium]
MKKRRCKNEKCRCSFEVNPRNPNQKYCSKEECQKARKATRQRRKMANDREYRAGQTDCRNNWIAKNPDYWITYRERNPKYTKRNREKQKERDRLKRISKADRPTPQSLAKMHPSMPQNHIIPGVYELIPGKKNNLAKMHPLIVEIREITDC